jgi:hypothetical protein
MEAKRNRKRERAFGQAGGERITGGGSGGKERWAL